MTILEYKIVCKANIRKRYIQQYRKTYKGTKKKHMKLVHDKKIFMISQSYTKNMVFNNVTIIIIIIKNLLSSFTKSKKEKNQQHFYTKNSLATYFFAPLLGLVYINQSPYEYTKTNLCLCVCIIK